MLNIRQNIFETNSSSSHSVSFKQSVNDDDYDYDYFRKHGYIDEYNILQISTGEFGFGPDWLEDPYDKLSYLITYAYECIYADENCDAILEEVLNETDSSKREIATHKFHDIELIINALKMATKCDDVKIESYLQVENFSSGEVKDYWLDHSGYVDHESVISNTLLGFLEYWDVDSIEDFIFNPAIVVHIDGNG